MKVRRFGMLVGVVLVLTLSAWGQYHRPRHSRYPNSPSNDPELQIPTDQAQSCFTPESNLNGYEQFQQFDTYPQPAGKGYLCINIPPGKTFVIDHLFAEADYDAALPADAEWYLDSVAGRYEQMIGFAAKRVGALSSNPHYILSKSVHLPVLGGTRVTLIMHSFYISNVKSIIETPGTASMALVGHWE